jgi:hypothetical protein
VNAVVWAAVRLARRRQPANIDTFVMVLFFIF